MSLFKARLFLIKFWFIYKYNGFYSIYILTTYDYSVTVNLYNISYLFYQIYTSLLHILCKQMVTYR